MENCIVSAVLSCVKYVYLYLVWVKCCSFVCSEDEEEQTRQNLANPLCQSAWAAEKRGHLQRIISIEEDPLPHLIHSEFQAPSPLRECSEAEEASDNEGNIDLVMSDIYPPASSARQKSNVGVEERETPTSLRGQPVGKETSMNVSM